MVEMIATSDIEYPAGIKRKTGDRFEAKDAHVKILRAMKRATPYETRDMAAAPAVEYVTRDIQPKRGPGRPRKVA